MLDHALESAICAAIKADHELGGLHFFTGLDDETHKLPAITVVSKSESLAGSAEVFRADVEIRVESHAKDTTPGEHAARTGRVRASLVQKAEMLASLNATGAVHVCGYAITGSAQEAGDEKFLSTITLKVGYQTPAN